ncbi:MAG: pyridoxamine 5'-phosphate oxidase family protein [Acidimicrobiia bacterium]
MTRPPLARTDHTTVRYAARASYDRDLAYRIIDETTVAHVGFVDDGRPFVIPMLHARIDDRLYLHGSPATRLMRRAKAGLEVCVTLTIVDGLVLARSAFHHSANYRSVVLFGTTETVQDVDERRRILDAYVDKLLPGRRPHLRPMTDKEVRGTAMASILIDEASVKMRTGGPNDEEEDYELPIWAGVLPVRRGYESPEPDPRNPAMLEIPTHIHEMTR